MRRVVRRRTFGLIITSVIFVSVSGAAANRSNDPRSEQRAGENQAQPSPAQKYFTDVTLVNQDGKEMRLYNDLLKGKVVLINSFFSTCTGSCPVMSATIARIQEQLGERVGKDVFLISVSVDPATDTPKVLKEYAQRFKARPGWYFLTGTKENVEFALTKLGQYVNEKQDHLNVMIIGNERTGLWKKAFGLAKPEDIIKILQSVISDQS